MARRKPRQAGRNGYHRGVTRSLVAVGSATLIDVGWGTGILTAALRAWFAGPAAAVADGLAGYADAGLTQFAIRFTGDDERQLKALADIGARVGW